MGTHYSFWIFFNVFIIAMLALDLGVLRKKSQTVSFKESLLWTLVWIGLAVIFNILVYFWKGPEKAMEFTTGYLVELSLSVDNLFIFIVIFRYFQIPTKYQHRVLFWGIIGALIMRAIFIFAGVALIEKFHWIIYVFGGIVILSGIRMFFNKEEKLEPQNNPVLKLFMKFVPITTEYNGDKFFTRMPRLTATPLAIALIIVETTDLIFAVDSVPAILAITTDTFIVYTSNVFAILGLRSLYFSLAGIHSAFRYLQYGLSAILVFIGLKMVLSDVIKLKVEVALLIIISILLISIVASLLIKPKKDPTSEV